MTTVINRGYAQSLRIIWAITVRDIGEALQNKRILSNLLSIAFLLLFYRMAPILFDGDAPPEVAVYDVGSSPLVDELENNPALDIHTLNSRQQMERYLGKSTNMCRN
jgi:hypothetical protein